MQDLPKLNAVAVDNEPEPSAKVDEKFPSWVVWFSVFAAVFLVRQILVYSGLVPLPIQTSQLSWWIGLLILGLVVTIIEFLLSRSFSETTAQTAAYYITVLLVYIYLAVLQSPFPSYFSGLTAYFRARL